MKQLIVILLAGALFTGCVTQRRCERRFPPQTSTEIITVTRDSIVFKPLIIRDTIPGDTVTVEVELPAVPCEELSTMVSREATAEVQYAVARAWVAGGRVNLELRQKQQVIERLIEDAFKEAYYWRERYENEKTVVTERYIPKFYRFTFVYFLATALIILLFLYRRVKRG